ncbi:MAG TPA: hypothetical protein VFX59_00855, partial [Polyangiales bacterium]|nr:hypothetical protein [Polyangiales bacterium]
ALKVRETFAQSRSLPVVAPRRTAAALLELGGALSTGAHTRGLGLLAFGLRRATPRGFGELVLFGKLASAVEEARVREREWALGVAARLGFTRGRFALGPALGLALVRASAHGLSEDGRSGYATRVSPRLDLALDLRVALAWSLALRFAPALELDPIAERYTVERDTLALRHVRLVLPLSLVIGIGS